MKKWLSYIILLLTTQFFNAMLSGYSVAKHAITSDLEFSETFYGIIQMLAMGGRFISNIYLFLQPSDNLNRTYFICVGIQIVSFLFLICGDVFSSLSEILFVLGMAGFGVGRGIYSFPYLILSEIFHPIQETTAVNIWFGLNSFGNIWGFILETWMLEGLGIHWSISFLALMGIYLLTGILTYYVVPHSSKILPNQNTSMKEKIIQKKLFLKDFFRRRYSNIFLLIDYCFQENLIFIFLLWCPYFFINHNFSYFNTTLIALTFPVATALGSLVINPLLSNYPDRSGRRTLQLVIMEYLCFLSCVFIEVDEKNLLYFIVFFGLGFIFYMVPYSKSTTTEVSERLQNGKEEYLMINFMKIVRGILTTFSLFVAGFIMNIDVKYFFNIFMGNVTLILFFHGVRRIVECIEGEQKAQLQQSLLIEMEDFGARKAITRSLHRIESF